MFPLIPLLVRIIGSTTAKNLVLYALGEAVKRTDNTIDDDVVRIVRAGFAGTQNPTGKPTDS